MNSRHRVFAIQTSLLRDRVRTEAFGKAIAQTVRPGHVVVDVGCGTGILSFLACAAGAKRVYSIERDDFIAVARELAAANGFSDRIVFLDGLSRAVALPERADVLVSEILGNGGLDEGILDYFIDAQKRFLAPGGVSIPRRIEIETAAVEIPDFYSETVGCWQQEYGFDFSRARGFAAQQCYPFKGKPSDLRSGIATLMGIDLLRLEACFVSGRADLTLQSPSTIHGLAVWFRTQLSPGVVLTNSPPSETPSWWHMFLPLEVPLSVAGGETMQLEVSTYDGRIWRWKGDLRGPGGHVTSQFDHSTFHGFPITRRFQAEFLRGRVQASLPRAEAAALVLRGLAEGATVESIGQDIARRFPESFPTEWGGTDFARRLISYLS